MVRIQPAFGTRFIFSGQTGKTDPIVPLMLKKTLDNVHVDADVFAGEDPHESWVLTNTSPLTDLNRRRETQGLQKFANNIAKHFPGSQLAASVGQIADSFARHYKSEVNIDLSGAQNSAK